MTPAKFTALADPLHGTDGGRPEFVGRLADGREIGNPFIAAGNCLPGPFLPFGMVRPGPDAVFPQPSSGYRSDRPILRFTQTHVSGTGGGGRYGNIGVTPFAGPARQEPWAFAKENERATPGAYSVRLQPGEVDVEITATKQCAVYRFGFAGDAAPCLLIDAGAIVMTRNWSDGGTDARSVSGYIQAHGTAVFGRGDVAGGYGPGDPYSVFFWAETSVRAARSWTANGGEAELAPGTRVDGAGSRLVLEFAPGTHEIEWRIGISFVSVGHARRSVARECGARSFDDLRAAAAQTWEEIFQRIQVDVDEPWRGLFYTGFLRLLCMPAITGAGEDGENPFWRSGVPQVNDYYCLWDSARNANQLIHLILPQAQRDILNGLLDVAEHTGWLPDAFFTWVTSSNQGGSTGDVLFAEAALKGLTGVDYERALHFIRKNIQFPSPNPWLHGRYPGYRERGWLATDVRHSISRQVEYSYHDACAAALAEHLGRAELAADFRAGAQKVWNLWREETGCLTPRQPAGGWMDGFDPAATTPRYWENPHSYEGSAIAWSLNILQDIPGLIARLGGPAGFQKYLNDYFAARPILWKEIVLHTPYLYHWLGRPDLSARQAREILYSHYRPGPAGMPDNEDVGAQSAFVMWTILGLYPVMGQDLYLVFAPLARTSRIVLGETGATLEIRADRDPAAAPCLVGVRLNGLPLDRCWLRHRELTAGGTLEIALSDTPCPEPWPLPPSLSQP